MTRRSSVAALAASLALAQPKQTKIPIGVATNDAKAPMFSLDERVAMVKTEAERLAAGQATIAVVPFNTLLVKFAAQLGASVIIRGLRAVSDFEYEFQMAGMNARLDPDVETVFLMASERQQFISSRFIKEIGRLGGRIDEFVSPRVNEHLKRAFQDGR